MMDTASFYQLLINRGYAERTLLNEPMARHTTFGIGGPADILVSIDKITELQELVSLARQSALAVIVIGEGSNILVADTGVRGLVIINRCNRVEKKADNVVEAESGALLRQVARCSVEQGLEGLEWASGVPGTIGGAVVGNAGAYGGSIADNLLWAELFQTDGRIERITNASLLFGYRSSMLKRTSTDMRPLVERVAFGLKKGDTSLLAQKMQVYAKQRNERTPTGRSAGSVFKRTLQYPAGFLIEQCGLKGFQLGGAQISLVHANFIINVGQATAADVAAVIELVQQRVWEMHSQTLEPELEFIGAWERIPGR
jgi:UDP-N-acetylmuramate dehydrogenase